MSIANATHPFVRQRSTPVIPIGDKPTFRHSLSPPFTVNKYLKAVITPSPFQICRRSLRHLKTDMRNWTFAVSDSALLTNVLKLSGGLEVGESLDHDGDVIVYGDVPTGAHIQAGGDVTVWGRLEGEVHAGYPDKTDASIRAVELASSKIKIGLVERTFSQPHGVVPMGLAQVTNRENDSQEVQVTSVVMPNSPSDRSKESRPASRMAKTAMFTGTYAIALGLALLLFPRSIYGLLFDLTKVTHGLIRLGGVFLALVGMQYIGVVKGEQDMKDGALGFYTSTIASRMFLVVCVGFFVGMRFLEWTWVFFAALNGLGALSMSIAIQRERQGTGRK